jgi:protein-tyrosine phosphatase
MKILFVCTGNICRSPTADGVLRAKALAAGLEWDIDSCGTHAYHIGEAPDPRSIKHAKTRGYDLGSLVARKIDKADFDKFDVILCLDRTHFEQVERMKPKGSKAEVHLYMEYAGAGKSCVPDPYYGNYRDFEYVLDLIENASDAIIKKFI